MIYSFYKRDIECDSYKPLYIKISNFMSESSGNKDKKAGIYFIKKDINTLSYVGQSRNLASRLTTHIRNKYKDAYSITYMEVDKCDLDDVENFFINKLEPLDNIMCDLPYDIKIIDKMLEDYGQDEYIQNHEITHEMFTNEEYSNVIYPSKRKMVDDNMEIDIYNDIYDALTIIGEKRILEIITHQIGKDTIKELLDLS